MKYILFLFFSLFAFNLIAQEESLVTISVNMPGGGVAQGTGVVIKKLEDAPHALGEGYRSLILTAAHVVEGSSTYNVLYTNGQPVSNSTLVSKDEKADVAILKSWTPSKISPVPLGETIQEEEEIFICSPRGIRRTKVSAMDENEIFADVFFVSGESGSPVLNSKKEVIGVVSGGNTWFKDKKFEIRKNVLPNSEKEFRVSTWPGRMGHIFSIKKIIK
jgi:S1-C subfamily serine protease